MTPIEAYQAVENAIMGIGLNPELHRIYAQDEWTHRMVTGEDHEEWVRAVRKDETKREKDNRWDVYVPVTKSAISPVRTYYTKMYRVDGIRKSVTGERAEEVLEELARFHGGRGLMDYLELRHPNKLFLDPNGFLIVGNDVTRDAVTNRPVSVSVFPIEVPGSEVIASKMTNGLHDWIIRLQLVGEGSARKLYTLYGAGVVVSYREFLAEEDDALPEGAELKAVEDATYVVTTVEKTGSLDFPGIQWGAYESESGTRKVSPLDPVTGELDELVKQKAILDVVYDHHVRPHRYEYGGPCEYRTTGGLACAGRGYINLGEVPERDRITCPNCGGSGSQRKTENNVTRVKAPEYENANEIIKLSDLYHYEEVPLGVVENLDNRLERLKTSIPFVVFSAKRNDAPAASTAPRTATENIIEADFVNNRVWPAAGQASRIWMKVATITAQYMNTKVEASHAFPENLKLEGLTELINRLGAARANGVSQTSIFAIQCEIAEKVQAGNISEVENMKAFERHRPWRSMSEGVAASIRMERAPTDVDRRLFENFDRLTTEVLEKQPEFYLLDYARQRAMILACLAEIETDYLTVAEPAENPFADVEE